MKIPELLRSLEYIRDSTGDPLFSDTIAAIESYGFKGRGLKRGGTDASKQSWGDPDEGYLNHIRFDIERFGWSVPESTQHIVAQYKAPGQSFDTIVDRLATKYRAWAAAGHPAPIIADPGDIGQRWTVFPVGDAPLNLGHAVVPVEGLTVNVTNFWRRVFRDGSIRVQARTQAD
ncbi:hypothetical protein [Lichenibacterium dinghuense]|uniref:hypothetical protein n=1 Tax=Lichenibacterium dinghuense TaxID=2895977 RepID=UPI001F1EC5DB|nr:hypothetical protein [Lichenibacterium sp. 6Y81]